MLAEADLPQNRDSWIISVTYGRFAAKMPRNFRLPENTAKQLAGQIAAVYAGVQLVGSGRDDPAAYSRLMKLVEDRPNAQKAIDELDRLYDGVGRFAATERQRQDATFTLGAAVNQLPRDTGQQVRELVNSIYAGVCI